MDRSCRDDTVAEWYAAYAGHLYAYLARLLTNPEDRRDVVQETFVRGIIRFGDYDPRRDACAWLTAIARNLAIDRLRRAFRRERSISGNEISNWRSPELSAVISDERSRLAGAVAALPPRDRAIVDLYYYRELSVAEVAAILAIPAGTVKFRLFRARRDLAVALEGTRHET
jgi:RNA polymerase sigma-70 factor (ECF subfamily)